MSAHDFKKVLDDAKVMVAARAACPRHHFERIVERDKDKVFSRFRCTVCGGEAGGVERNLYEAGLAHGAAEARATEAVITCVYCGHAYPPGSPTHGATMLTAHVRVCEKHPLRAVEKERDSLKAENERLRAALRRVVDHGFEHPDHHRDECPEDPCKSHRTADLINAAMARSEA